MKTSIREGDLVYIADMVREVDGVVELDDGSLEVSVADSSVSYMLTRAQAQDALVAREEDMYSSTTLDLRYKESMLVSQIILMSQVTTSTMEWRQAMMELERTLYAVRFVLGNRGARRVDERFLSS